MKIPTALSAVGINGVWRALQGSHVLSVAYQGRNDTGA